MLVSQIKEITLKINKLVVENTRLRSAEQGYIDTIDQLKKEQEQTLMALKECEEQLAALKSANAILGSDDYKTQTKLKINALIREIDQCINQLAS